MKMSREGRKEDKAGQEIFQAFVNFAVFPRKTFLISCFPSSRRVLIFRYGLIARAVAD
jgi:hypothetical protein